MSAAPLQVELCLNESECFPLRRPLRQSGGQSERTPQQRDVHMFEGLAIPHEEIDRFELRTSAPTTVVPACMSLRFDGQPVYCQRSFDSPLGAGAWAEPDDASSCFSCWDRGSDVDLRITHGPFVGARHAGKATIWSRTDASIPVELIVSPNADMSESWVEDTQTPAAEDDFTLRLVAGNLTAGQRYYYQLRAGGELHVPTSDPLHPTGIYNFEMPPASDTPTTVRFGLGSCARAFNNPIFESLRAKAPDLLLLVGDYHYGNVLEDRGYDVPSQNPEADDPFLAGLALDDFRWWYRSAHEARAGMLADVPILSTWDDHDYGGNFRSAHGANPGSRHARRSVLEYFANPQRTANPRDEATYFRQRQGNVEFFVLDARTHRPRLAPPDFDEAVDPSSDPLGAEQSDWLVQALSSSDATFKIVASGTKWDGNSNKAWGPFRVARNALLQRIANAGVDGVVFVSGGPHSTQYRTFQAAGRTWHEIVASPLSSGVGSCHDPKCAAVRNFVIAEADDTLADPRLRFRVFDEEGKARKVDDADYLAVLRSSDLD